jgi:hypothetical protein
MIARNKAEIVQAVVVHKMITRPHDEADHRGLGRERETTGE